jgi:GntR family transcriptional regulator
LALGEAFPSVRALSKALKINPNTAHKVVIQLEAEGLVEVRPGMNTVVAGRTPSTAAERVKLLKKEVESLAVEAKRLGLDLETLIGAVREHWIRLESGGRAMARRQ